MAEVFYVTVPVNRLAQTSGDMRLKLADAMEQLAKELRGVTRGGLGRITNVVCDTKGVVIGEYGWRRTGGNVT